MTRAAALPILALSLLLSSATPFVHVIAPATFVPREPTMSIYEVAEFLTGAPAEILRAIAIAESGEDPNAVGDNGESIGIFQNRRKYQEYRNAKHGTFDPRDPRASAIVAGREFMEHRARLGSDHAAICAHNQGADGVKLNGLNVDYLMKVSRALARIS